jgi:CheY-like chemotaxis protein
MAKIMLVEDDNNLREIYQARLETEGYEIISAQDGEEALALAVKEKPDLIISDVMMPKISGFDMLDILRGTPEVKDTKVIMMTALSQAEDKARADKLGADRYLVKSQVTLEDVARVAREVLEGKPDSSMGTAGLPAGAVADVPGAAAPAAAPATDPAAAADPAAAPPPAPPPDPAAPPAPAGDDHPKADEPASNPQGTAVAAGAAATPVAAPVVTPPADPAPPEPAATSTPVMPAPAPAEPAAATPAEAEADAPAAPEAQAPANAEPTPVSMPVSAPPLDSIEALTEAGKAQTTVQEEAEMKDQIEDFIEKQTGAQFDEDQPAGTAEIEAAPSVVAPAPAEPAKTAAAPSPEPAKVPEPASAPGATTTPPVHEPSAPPATELKPAPAPTPAPVPQITPAKVTPVSDPVLVTPPAPESQNVTPRISTPGNFSVTEDMNNKVNVNGKKVIAPINNLNNRPDLAKMAEDEEARAVSSAQVFNPGVGSVIGQAGAVAPAGTNPGQTPGAPGQTIMPAGSQTPQVGQVSPDDPNSIAL